MIVVMCFVTIQCDFTPLSEDNGRFYAWIIIVCDTVTYPTMSVVDIVMAAFILAVASGAIVETCSCGLCEQFSEFLRNFFSIRCCLASRRHCKGLILTNATQSLQLTPKWC